MSRYIDAEFAKADIDLQETHGFFDNFDLCEFLDEVPTADVAEVRHSNWIKHGDYCSCSECNGSGVSSLNYCPTCGAKMDKEAQDAHRKRT